MFMDCLELEENAKSLALAAPLGRLLPMTDNETEQLKVSYGRNDYRISKIWEHYLHKANAAGLL